jgi:hypothetical protein
MGVPGCGEKARDEKMRITVFILLILTTIILIGIFWLPAKAEKAMMPKFPPMLDKGMDEPKPGQKIVIIPQPAPPPESSYQKAKKEILSWLEIAGKGSPVITMILAVRMARKKKGKR